MPETQHHSIDFVLTATTTTPAAAIQGTKAGQSPAPNAPGLHQVVGDQRGKGSGRDIAQGLGNAGRQGPPAQGERRRDAKERDSSPRRQPQNQELVNGHRGHLFRQIQHRTPAQWQCRPRRLPARQYSRGPRTCIRRRTPRPKPPRQRYRATAAAKRAGR